MEKLRNIIATFAVAMLAACAGLPPQAGRTETHALDHTETTHLGAVFVPAEQQHSGGNAFHLLPDPVDALVARMLLSEVADRSLDLQATSYGYNDTTGRELAALLLRAADTGFVDDLGTNADDQLLLALNSHPNMEIRLFNPVANRSLKKLGAVFEFFRVNRRMHNKAMIADNQGAIVGGRNIGDEYFGASSDFAFGDLDVLVHGPVVRKVSDAFDEYWNSDAAYPIDRLTGRRAEPTALAAYREKLDAAVAAQQNSPYFVQARQQLLQVGEPATSTFPGARPRCSTTIRRRSPARLATLRAI